MFSGLRVAIGGAGQGLGAACARRLAGRGAHLLLCARSREDLAALEEELRGIQRRAGNVVPGKMVCIATDLGTDAGAEAFARMAHERLGGLDVGLICAGISQQPSPLAALEPGPEAAGDAQRLLEQLQGNTVAPALAAIALARAWSGRDARAEAQRAPSDPHILVLSSLVTRLPAQRGLGPYLAAKSALEALVRTLAEELWPRVRVNALCVGPMATRLHEQAGTPPEVIATYPSPDALAPLVLELLGPIARGLSGRCIDAESFAADPEAALWGDGRLAQISSLHPPPSENPPDAQDAPLEPEPGRSPSPRVRRALRETASSLQRYPTDADRLARRLAELHGVPPDSILLSGGGATALLERALFAVGQAGDELISPFPTFEVLSPLASRAGLRHRLVPSRQDAQGMFEPHRAQELLASLGPRTRCVYVASPDNPTGSVLPREEELALRRALGAKTALILDEAWSLEVPDEPRADVKTSAIQHDLVDTQSNSPLSPLLRLRSLSKLHGLAGLRVGYAIASPELASLLRRLELPFPLGAPQLAAALAALDDLPRARKVAQLLRRKRERLANGIRALGLVASEGVSPLILVRDPKPWASAGPLLFALRAAGIAVQEAHWDAAALTLSVGTPAQDRRALEALTRARAGDSTAEP